MLKIIREDKNSKVLVITPLFTSHKISSETKKTINRNNIPFTWISYTSANNCAKNAQLGFEEYEKLNKLIPKYLIKIDNDIILGRNMLDRLVETLEETPDYIAYSYCSFEFKGHVNFRFPAKPFDIRSLLQANFISSNSLIKTDVLKHVDGFVTNDQYKRLLDWAMWLKLFKFGYIGKECNTALFVAISKSNDVSAGDAEDYKIKALRVMKDFVLPIIENRTYKKKFQENQVFKLDSV